jgi:hypothetical protein
MEQRQDFRALSQNTEVHISDRAGFCTGTLKDFSRSGICITDIPRKIHLNNGCFTIVVSDEHMNFKLKVEERWRAKEGLSTKVGVTIEDVPWDWTEMVIRHEPQKSAKSKITH